MAVLQRLDMKYKPDDEIGSSGLGGCVDSGGGGVGEMLVTSRSSIGDQELLLRLRRLPEAAIVLLPLAAEDASDKAGVTGDSRCLMWSILQGASHFSLKNTRLLKKIGLL